MNIQSNTAANNTWTNYSASLWAMKRSLSRLSSGTVGVADDPAGTGIGARLSSQADAISTSISNIDSGISMAQTADSWMQQVGDSLSRMKSLTIEQGGVTSQTDRQNIQTEFKAMQDNIKSITTGATAASKFNGLYLTRGGNGVPNPVGGGVQSGEMTIQIGADANQTLALDMPNLDATNNTVIGTVNSYTYNEQNEVVASLHTAVTWNDVMTMSAGTPNATGMLDVAIDYVANARATMGSEQARMESTRSGLMTYEDNIRESEGKITDVDMASESTSLAKSLMLLKSGTAMLGQANKLPAYALSLLK